MKPSLALVLIVFALAPCDPSSGPDAKEPQDPPAPAESGPSAMAEARNSVTAHMDDHLTRASAIHDAVVLGRLADAKRPAGHLAQHWPDQVLETWVPFVRSLRAGAAEVERSEELAAAAQATAQLALACGECHQALDDGPKFEASPELPSGDDAAAFMKRHRWAADRLWEGVIQPSAERWSQGIDALERMPPCQEDPGGEQLEDTIEAARDATERVRASAEDARTLDDRARLYGELLATCASCHLAGC